MGSRKKYRYKQDRLLRFISTAGWTALIAGLLIVAVSIRHLAAVRGYRNDLAGGIAYAQQNFSLTAQLDDSQPVRLTGSESGTLYRLFTGPALRSSAYPKQYLQQLTLSCGDGTVLEVALVSDTQLHLRLTAEDGKVRCFAMQFTGMERWFQGLLQITKLI